MHEYIACKIFRIFRGFRTKCFSQKCCHIKNFVCYFFSNETYTSAMPDYADRVPISKFGLCHLQGILIGLSMCYNSRGLQKSRLFSKTKMSQLYVLKPGRNSLQLGIFRSLCIWRMTPIICLCHFTLTFLYLYVIQMPSTAESISIMSMCFALPEKSGQT